MEEEALRLLDNMNEGYTNLIMIKSCLVFVKYCLGAFRCAQMFSLKGPKSKHYVDQKCWLLLTLPSVLFPHSSLVLMVNFCHFCWIKSKGVTGELWPKKQNGKARNRNIAQIHLF